MWEVGGWGSLAEEDEHEEPEEGVEESGRERAGEVVERTVMHRDSLTELGHSYWKPSSKRVKASREP